MSVSSLLAPFHDGTMVYVSKFGQRRRGQLAIKVLVVKIMKKIKYKVVFGAQAPFFGVASKKKDVRWRKKCPVAEKILLYLSKFRNFL